MKEFIKEKFNEDLLYMFDIIKKTHPNLYYVISERELNSLIDNYMKDKNINTYEKSIYYIMQIFNRIGDSHTKLNFYNNKTRVKFTVIDKSIYVKEYDKLPSLVGGKLTCINGVDINNILRELSEIIVPRTIDGIYSEIEHALSNKVLLMLLPSIEGNDRIKYTIKKDGKTYKIKENVFEVNQIKKDKEYYNYRRENNVIIINYKRCKNMDDYTFDSMVESIKQEEGIFGYIVDLRGNDGGNSSIIKPLIEFLKDKKVVTLIDKAVFSSGIIAMVDLRRIGSVLIGTNVAERVNSFGETFRGKTENYDMNFICSKKYFYLKDNEIKYIEGQEEYKKFESDQSNVRYLYPVWIQPDLYKEKTYEDLINNTDSVLEFALDFFKNK